MRNPVLISHLDPDNHQWAKGIAEKLTKETGQKTTMSNIINQAVFVFKQKFDDEEAMKQAKANEEPWLKEESAN